jgi:polyisoprenyl-teichoic acid--peptidoglycan teichoic acid transferase
MKRKKVKIKDNNEKKSKSKKAIKVISVLFIIVQILAMFTLLYSIYIIKGIETELRYVFMALVAIINIISIIITPKLLKKEKQSKFFIFVIIASIFIFAQAVGSYYILKTYSTLSSMNKNEITYTTAFVTLKDSNIKDISSIKDAKIGIVEDETSIEGYIIGKEVIKENKLEDNNTLVDYEDFTSLVKGLYSKDIDIMIVSEDYVSMFDEIDEYKNIASETKIIYKKEKTYTKDEIAKLTGEDTNISSSDKIDEPFTVLVMGIDSTASTLKKNASGNGDALMLLTFNPKTLNATILSIPRDTYVPIACFTNQKENKITHAAWNGASCMIKTIENFTGIDIDYYVKVNFQGVVKLVDAMDGIEVDVPLDFCESNSKRATSEDKLICLKEGKQTLNGEQALALARHRKTLLTGDLQRGVNQQLVIQGMLNKVKSIKSAGQMLKILDMVSQNIDTNFTTNQILSFYDIAKNLVLTSSESSNLINIRQLYLSGSSQMIYDERSGLVLYNYIPNESSLNQIVKAMKDNLSAEPNLDVKRMDFNIEEEYEMETIGTDNLSATSTYTLLPNFVGKSESYAINWLSSNGVSYEIKENIITSGTDGIVTDQSYPENKRIDLISGKIVITVNRLMVDTSSEKEESSESDTSSEKEESSESDTSSEKEESSESSTPSESEENTNE